MRSHGCFTQPLDCATSGLRNRVALTAAYVAGLRIGEVASLKLSSIDSKRMLIHLENGKGGRERYAMLSPHLLDVLRAYGNAGDLANGFSQAEIPVST